MEEFFGHWITPSLLWLFAIAPVVVSWQLDGMLSQTGRVKWRERLERIAAIERPRWSDAAVEFFAATLVTDRGRVSLVRSSAVTIGVSLTAWAISILIAAVTLKWPLLEWSTVEFFVAMSGATIVVNLLPDYLSYNFAWRIIQRHRQSTPLMLVVFPVAAGAAIIVFYGCLIAFATVFGAFGWVSERLLGVMRPDLVPTPLAFEWADFWSFWITWPNHLFDLVVVKQDASVWHLLGPMLATTVLPASIFALLMISQKLEQSIGFYRSLTRAILSEFDIEQRPLRVAGIAWGVLTIVPLMAWEVLSRLT